MNYYDQPHIKFLKRCIEDDKALNMAELVSTTFGVVMHHRIAITQANELKEAILELDSKWPVLIETMPESLIGDSFGSDGNTVVYTMSQKLMWATNEEYVKMFGHKSPTSPLVRKMLEQYKHREGFRPEWLN